VEATVPAGTGAGAGSAGSPGNLPCPHTIPLLLLRVLVMVPLVSQGSLHPSPVTFCWSLLLTRLLVLVLFLARRAPYRPLIWQLWPLRVLSYGATGCPNYPPAPPAPPCHPLLEAAARTGTWA